jgi:hypothetical protein
MRLGTGQAKVGENIYTAHFDFSFAPHDFRSFPNRSA